MPAATMSGSSWSKEATSCNPLRGTHPSNFFLRTLNAAQRPAACPVAIAVGKTRALVKLVEKGATKDDIYTQMDQVFKYENKIKKKHLGLMIVIRDILTKKQKKYLDDIKEKFIKEGYFNEGRRGKRSNAKRPFRSGPSQPF